MEITNIVKNTEKKYVFKCTKLRFFVLTQMLVINSDRISIYGNIDLFKLNFNYLLKYK